MTAQSLQLPAGVKGLAYECQTVGIQRRLRVQMVNDRLVLRTKDVIYEDHFAESGGYKAGVTEATDEYWLTDGKLHGKTTSQSVVVTPDTLAPIGTPTSNVAEEGELP